MTDDDKNNAFETFDEPESKDVEDKEQEEVTKQPKVSWHKPALIVWAVALTIVIGLLAVNAASPFLLTPPLQRIEKHLDFELVGTLLYPIKNETNVTIAMESYITIKNVDTEPGTFNVFFNFILPDGEQHEKLNITYLEPGEEKQVFARIDVVNITSASVQYIIEAPTIIVEE